MQHSAIWQSVVTLSVIMLNVVMLSVVPPHWHLRDCYHLIKIYRCKKCKFTDCIFSKLTVLIKFVTSFYLFAKLCKLLHQKLLSSY